LIDLIGESENWSIGEFTQGGVLYDFLVKE